MSRAVAFFKLEPLLVDTSSTHVAAYLASQHAGMRERIGRLGQVLASAPVALWSRATDGALSNRLLYAGLRGMNQARLTLLAHEVADSLRARVHEDRVALLARERAEGRMIVVLSELPHELALALTEGWAVDHLAANRLHMREGWATGRLLEPILGGPGSLRWVREFARAHDVDLARSCAYASHADDGLMLSAVGEPRLVSPSRGLSRMARNAGWDTCASSAGPRTSSSPLAARR
jgi:phosphoserine phosphatase